MEYQEFKEILKQKVEEALVGENIEVVFETIEKNNGVCKEVLTFQEEGMNGMPAIHLKELFQFHLTHGKMDITVGEVLHILSAKMKVKISDIIGDWKTSKEKIYVKVVNYEWNKAQLETCLHRRFLDLALVAQLEVYGNEHGRASMPVQSGYLKEWGISEEKLWNAAAENIQKQEFKIQNLFETIREMLGEEVPEEGMSTMYIMTSKSHLHGAVSILRTDLLDTFASEMGGSFYILPSSTHELLLLPHYDQYDSEELKRMVREVNNTSVLEEERLSDNIYLYRSETHKLEVA